jgi:hypothetical protein
MKRTLDSLGLAVAVVIAGAFTSLADSRALFFDGVNDYVTLGAATNINNIGVSNFTVECWFKREGTGKVSYTGTGGIYAVPLVTKGMAENEGGTLDCNWFFGIGTNNSGQAALAADFEDYNNGLNHPVRGNTVVGTNVWVHGAVTYNVASSNWTLYVNGALDVSTNITGPSGITNVLMLFPRYDSRQHGALASSLLTTGVTNSNSGFLRGVLDEVRIWNYARSAQEIADNYNLPIASAAGLIARWGLDQTSGSFASNSISGGVSGVLTNGPVWTNGYFLPPTVTITNPINNATISTTSVVIEAAATDAEGSVAKVEFFAGNTSLGEDASEPYSVNWTGVGPGTYALKAVATDNIGLTATSSVVNVTVTPPAGVGALYFDGRNDYVTMGVAPGLGVSNFTVECWFKLQGAGKRANTGSGGIYALPLVTKGMAENEAGATNMNYFFGIGTNNSGEAVLAADFEDLNNGLNHPIRGNALVASNTWQHAAVTYDVASSNWILYVNGALDKSTNITGPSGITNALMLFPRFDSIEHAALGSCLRTGGATNADSGFFAGTIDEVRIWNYARSAQDIADNYAAQIPSAAGLIARWSLDDGSGLAATNSGTSEVAGTLTNGPVWVEGHAFTSPPVITNEPASQSAQCGENVNFAVGASGTPPLAYQWYFGSNPLAGRTEATLSLTNVSAMDAGTYSVSVSNTGNTVSSAPAVLTVTDTNPPTITVCATNMTLDADANCQGAIPDLTGQVTASDACGAATISQSPAAGTPVGLGDHLVTLTASDAANNQATCAATITVVDVTAPVITLCATNISLNAGKGCQAAIPDLTGQVATSDACGAVAIAQSPVAGTLVGLGDHLVTLTASDAATNQATCTATITVLDVVAPLITVCATNLTLNADTNCQAAIPDLIGQVIATDACGAVSLSQSPTAGTLVGLGNHLVTLTVSDAATNQATCTATITVVDVTAPVITVCATNLTLNADTNCQAAIPDLIGQVAATDACGAATLSQSPAAGTLVGLGDHLVTLIASDAATNQAGCLVTITVADANTPVITAQPQSQTILVGSTVSFTVAASSCSTVGYQWLFGTNALAEATLPTLTLTNVTPGQAGEYSVVLTNAAGSTPSAVAALTVQLPSAPTLAVGPSMLPNGHFQVGFAGTPNVPYTIEVTVDVLGVWETLTNITADSNGLILIEDFTTPAPPTRFYRTVYP